MNRIKLVVVMLLWGSIGLFSRFIPLSPIQLAFWRAILALPVLAIMIPRTTRLRKLNRKSVLIYMISGGLIGLAWTALFYGYSHTSIATAVIIYNMCPVYVMILAPFVLHEQRSRIHSIVIAFSLVGLLFIVGTSNFDGGNLLGVLMSGISGMIYAVIVLVNRKIKVKIESNTATFIQMSGAAIVLVPFVWSSGPIESLIALNPLAILLTLILGIIHTGLAYSLYFSTYHHMKSIDIVTFSYLEPVFALVVSIIFLSEHLTMTQVVGASLILGSTIIGENVKAGRIKSVIVLD